MSLDLTTAPTVFPIDVDDVKQHCRIEHSHEDNLIEDIIVPAVTEQVEVHCRRSLLQQTKTLWLDCWPTEQQGLIELPEPPHTAVNSVKYIDADGVLQTLVSGTDYTTHFPTGPQATHAQVYPAYEVDWPVARRVRNAIQIEFVAGYGTAKDDVPALIRKACLLLAGDMYEHREQTIVSGNAIPRLIPTGIELLLRSFVAEGNPHT